MAYSVNSEISLLVFYCNDQSMDGVCSTEVTHYFCVGVYQAVRSSSVCFYDVGMPMFSAFMFASVFSLWIVLFI
jgi:hypothetical protein